MLRSLSRRILPRSLRRRLVRLTRWPPVGSVKFENLRRLEPVSRSWGGDRGLPIDRYYIEQFLDEHRACIQGQVIEIGDDQYTRRFGTNVIRSEVLDITGHRNVTLVANLAEATGLPGEQFDCIICTQTLQFIPDVAAAIKGLHHLLCPKGVLLLTCPVASPLATYEANLWGDYWRFTTYGMRRLLTQTFAPESVSVRAYGNVLSTVAFFHGLATEELQQDELNHADPQFELLVAAHAVR